MFRFALHDCSIFSAVKPIVLITRHILYLQRFWADNNSAITHKNTRQCLKWRHLQNDAKGPSSVSVYTLCRLAYTFSRVVHVQWFFFVAYLNLATHIWLQTPPQLCGNVIPNWGKWKRLQSTRGPLAWLNWLWPWLGQQRPTCSCCP